MTKQRDYYERASTAEKATVLRRAADQLLASTRATLRAAQQDMDMATELAARIRLLEAEVVNTPRYWPGDPDPTPDWSEADTAPCGHTRYGLACAWPPGHENNGTPHIAGDGKRIAAVWA
jgi:hypothetical protein